VRNLFIISLILLGFIACGTRGRYLEKRIDLLLDNPNSEINENFWRGYPGANALKAKKFAFLNDIAKSQMVAVKKKVGDLRKQKRDICEVTPIWNEALKQRIEDVRKDKELVRAEKKKQVRAIFREQKPKRKENRKAMRKCRKEKPAEIKPIQDKINAIKLACLGEERKRGKGEKRRGWRGRRLKQDPSKLTDEQKSKMNDSLNSPSCSAALTA